MTIVDGDLVAIRCDRCRQVCIDFRKRNGQRICILCVSGELEAERALHEEDLETIAQIELVCERHGYDAQSGEPVADWLARALPAAPAAEPSPALHDSTERAPVACADANTTAPASVAARPRSGEPQLNALDAAFAQHCSSALARALYAVTNSATRLLRVTADSLDRFPADAVTAEQLSAIRSFGVDVLDMAVRLEQRGADLIAEVAGAR